MKERRTAFTLSDAPHEDIDNLRRGFKDILAEEQRGIDQLDAGETVDFDEVMSEAEEIIATQRQQEQAALEDLCDPDDLADVLDELDEILGAAPKTK